MYRLFGKKNITYIYLLPCLYNTIPNFKEFYKTITDCYLKTNGIVCITKDNKHIQFDIPKLYITDYNLILESKYSKVSGLLKLNIVKAHQLNSIEPEFGVLFRNIYAKKAFSNEIGGMYNFNTLNVNVEYWFQLNKLKESYTYNF